MGPEAPHTNSVNKDTGSIHLYSHAGQTHFKRLFPVQDSCDYNNVSFQSPDVSWSGTQKTLPKTPRKKGRKSSLTPK